MTGLLLFAKGAWKAITSPLGLTTLLAIALALAGWKIHATIYAAGAESRQGEIDGLNADIERMVRESKEAHDRAVADARALEERQRKALALIALEYERERDNAKRAAERVAADLRAGTIRVRNEWQNCIAAAGSVPRATTDPAGPPTAAELRSAGTDDLLRIGAACDAQIAGLQRVILQLQGK